MSRPSQAPIVVLLVEDNPSDADLVVETLEDLSAHLVAEPTFAVERVDRLAAALRYLVEQEADAILLDLSLPDSQGLATFRRLHAHAPDLPIVVLSGLADEKVAAQAVREGAQDYLVKGESDERLLSRAIRYAIERKRAERDRARAEAAEATLRARDEFLAVAAHELKTPLTGLLAGVQLTIRQLEAGRTSDLTRLVERLRMTERQGVKLGRLVAQLFDISRLAVGKLPLEISDTDLASLVEEVATTAQGQTTHHRVQIRVNGRPRVRVDPLRIEQVLTNLIDNAIKFSPQGGDIVIEVAEPAFGAARVAVQDQGIGIPPDRRAKIFEPYYQAHSEEYRSGLGMGLYICRQIIDLHGGTIAAEFPPEGGMKVVIDLPAGDAPAKARCLI